MKIPVESMWKDIERLRESGVTYQEIANMYGTSKQCIHQGLRRRGDVSDVIDKVVKITIRLEGTRVKKEQLVVLKRRVEDLRKVIDAIGLE